MIPQSSLDALREIMAEMLPLWPDSNREQYWDLVRIGRDIVQEYDLTKYQLWELKDKEQIGQLYDVQRLTESQLSHELYLAQYMVKNV